MKPLNIAVHRNTMLQILKDIYSDTTLSPFLGFKGGTAAYMFYHLNRFSVDLDFDLLDKTREDYVFERVGQIVKKYGKIKDAKKKKYNLFFLLSCEEEAQNIKIEINRRLFSSRYEVMTYLGISMLVMVQEDMFAHKLIAMSERIGKANRDIYDVWFFLKNNWSINGEIIKKRAGLSLKELWQRCIASLEKMDNRNILAGLGEVLDKKQKIWVKENLKKDVLFLLKVKLESER
jgi:predicted nucleotidyltransferase component of viral defense system